MTTSDHTKVLKQIANKPAKVAKYNKYNVPKKRPAGRTTKKCKICGRPKSNISKYGINFCRHCFRENAQKLGFKKYS